MESAGKFLQLIWQRGGVGAIIWVVLSIAILGGIIYWQMHKAKLNKSVSITDDQIDDDSQPADTEQHLEGDKTVFVAKKKSILGTGRYKCLAVRGNILEWTTIPKPIGKHTQSETSMPVSGGIYIVRELQQDEIIDDIQKVAGDVVAYDPRHVKVEMLQTPEAAYFAINWPIVDQVYMVPKPWYTNIKVWFAAAMLIIVFLFGLMV